VSDVAPSSDRPSILLLSGPNLDLLGTREPQHYGHETLDDHVRTASKRADELGLDVVHLQSNHEGELVDAVHAARGVHVGIIVNAAALTHSSWALHDALAACDLPVVELHLSNPDSRESWRRTSVISPVASGVIEGFRGAGYRLAVDGMAALLEGT
jgi:3-dehydroquinate dehydratase-2